MHHQRCSHKNSSNKIETYWKDLQHIVNILLFQYITTYNLLYHNLYFSIGILRSEAAIEKQHIILWILDLNKEFDFELSIRLAHLI